MGLLKEVNDMANAQQPEAQEELQRIAEYWIENGHDMSEEKLRDAVADDLEQLDYAPEQVEQMLPQILNMIRGASA